MNTCIQQTASGLFSQRMLPSLPKPLACATPAPSVQKQILVVDDDAALCRLCAIVLTRLGHAVESASDGLKGWDALRANRYDLLITDIEMPRLNGLALAARVRLAGMRLPIVVLSGSLGRLENGDAMHLELAEMLQKPVSIPELIRVVEYALARSSEAEARMDHPWPSLRATVFPCRAATAPEVRQ